MAHDPAGARARALTAVAALGLVAAIAIGLEADTRAAAYVATALGVASATYLLYQAVLFRVWVEGEAVSSLRAAHRPAPGWTLDRWLGLDLGDLGTIRPGTAEARMYAELGTLTSERLAQGGTPAGTTR